jgi:TetR/AcrR family transcriptional regulator, tetracycline repressor protein
MSSTSAAGSRLRGRPPKVSRDDVVDAGLRVARRVGLPRLTMTLVAEELQVSVMAAYHHVANKQELLELMVDAVLGRVEVPVRTDGDWQARMTLLMRNARKELSQVEGIADIIRMHGPTPHAVRLADATVEILRDAGFGDAEATLAFDVIYAYVTGQLDLDRAGVEEGRVSLAALTTFEKRSSQPTADEIFDYGLQTVLIGLHARLEKRV